MNETFSLTITQMDAVNLSLSKAMAVAQMVAECGGNRRQVPDEPPPASLFVVMQVVVEELGKIVAVMQAADHEQPGHD